MNRILYFSFSHLSHSLAFRILSNARSILFIHSVRLHSIDYEAKFIAQCLVSVRHADLGDIGPTDVVPFRSIFQIVLS